MIKIKDNASGSARPDPAGAAEQWAGGEGGGEPVGQSAKLTQVRWDILLVMLSSHVVRLSVQSACLS